MLVRINWGATGGFYWIPLEIQKRVFEDVGKERYIKLPKPGTNPRGVEITKEALRSLVDAEETKNIEITWQRAEIDYKPYKRWVDYWMEE